jgi:hypothetical protein
MYQRAIKSLCRIVIPIHQLCALGPEGKVISERRDGLCSVTIQNEKGESIETPHWNLDCGREFRGRSREWVPESDPRVLRYLAKLRDEQPAVHECGLMNRQRASFGQNLNHVLQRNGYRG